MRFGLEVLLIFLTLAAPSAAFADTRLSAEGNYSDDSSNLTLSGAGTKTYADGLASFSLWFESPLYFTAGLATYSEKIPTTATKTSIFSTTAPFAGLTLVIRKMRHPVVSLGGYYSPTATATYSETGTATENWIGTGYLGKISFHPKIANHFGVTVSLNYLSVSFTNRSGTAVSTVNQFNRNITIPSLGFLLYW